MRRRILTALAVAAPFALAAWGSARLARASGDTIGAAVADAAASLPTPGQGLLDPPRPRETIVDPADAASVVFEDLPELDGDPASPSASTKTGKKKPPAPPLHPTRGIRVSAATVLRLANRGVRPSGSPVAANADRPAGLALQGVAGLGIGLRDGDVLTQVAGAPASSAGAVIGAVLAARQRRAPAMSGVVYRGGDKIALYVEMPYPK
ncbi:MAG: hypothetical protein ABJE95_13725 [Byssovorax sp.]